MIGGEVKALSDFVARGATKMDGVFRAMVDALPVAMYMTDAGGRLTYFNPAAVQLSGRVPSLGTDQWCITWRLFLADGTPLPHDQCPIAVALRGGEAPSGIECIAERPDGTRFWFMPYPAVLRDPEGRITGAVNVLIDITDRKKAEIEANEQFRAIVETTAECVKIVAPDGTLLFMNPSGLRMVGAASADAVLGQDVHRLIAPKDRDRFREFNAKVCGGAKASLEFEMVGVEGVRRQLESHGVPLRHTDGTTVHLAIARDIGERRRGERAALLLGAIVESSDDGIISKGLDGIITSWNKGAERIFGYTAAEAIGQSITMLMPPDRLAEEPKIIERLKRGERVDHFETIRRRKDGALVDISLTISPVKDKQGSIVGASKIARDITKRKKAEAVQKQVEDELRRANQDLEQFAFSASHDLQEPLRSVKIYSELLVRECNDAMNGEALQYLRYLRSGATRMEMLVGDLLAYTQATKFESAVEPADAGEALSSTLSAMRGVIAEAGTLITSDPLPVVRMHPTHLRQLFQNLIGNAIKYRSADRPSVVHVTSRRECGNWVFEVSDNGIGISPEYKESIFGLFKRLHTNDEYSGTGIGLAICRRIVDRYHGRIWVESEPGKGSAFRFTLPV